MGGVGTGGLMQFSPLYAGMASVYERFAQAEDEEGNVARFLREIVRGKSVLDAGCGTGKYIGELGPVADWYAGIDAAHDVLKFAEEKARAICHAVVCHGRAEQIPFLSESFDCAFSSWVLGTIVEDSAKRAAVSELRRVVKRGGSVYLIENDLGGDFEYIRGRFPDVSRTHRYNQWLEDAGAKACAQFESHFSFSSVEEGKSIIGAIWGEAAAARVVSARIGHRIIVYRL